MVTENQAIAQFQNVVKIADQSIRFFTTGGTNLVTLLTNVETALLGGYADQLEAALGQIRSAAFACYQANSPSIGAALMTWAQVINTNAAQVSPSSALAVIFQRMVSQSYAITSRQFTRGAVTPVGNTKGPGAAIVGNGAGYRIATDWAGNPMEASFAEVKQLTCVGDQFSSGGGGRSYGNPGREQFTLNGATPSKEGAFGLTLAGSGVSTNVEGQTVQQSICTNSDLSQNSGSGVATSIAGWTPTTSISNFTVDLANTFRALPGGLVKTSLRITAADTLYQALTTNAIDSTVPVLPVIAYNRQVGAGLATLQLTLGSQSWTVVLAAQTGWNWFVPTIDKKLWYQNFTQNGLQFKFGLSAFTSGYVLVAEPMLLPATFVDGSGWWILGNTTPFALGDYLTATDTEVGAEIQQHVFRLFQVYLPSADPAPAVGTLTVVQSATAGAITAGTHVVAVSIVDINGVESAPSAVSAPYTADGSHKADVSNIPLGPSNTASRWVYMSKAGTTTPLYRVVQVSDNTTTTQAAIGVADASLTVASVAGGITISEP